ncbi:MAG TPA: hypothetical protein ENN30_00780 [Candidatus Woesearchaeota archaeon]|nr:hypothetical protein [Candidatus Woesearchaeota archaeon]
MNIYKHCLNFLIFALIFLTSLTASMALEFSAEFPEEVEIGKWFQVSLNIESEENAEVETYSYVFEGLNCISQGWTTNKKKVALAPGEPELIILEDMIKTGAEEGIYKIRVKVNSGNLSLNDTAYVKVMQPGKTMNMETFLYPILVVLSIAGLVLFFKFNR